MTKYNLILIIIILMTVASCTPEPTEINVENQFGALPEHVEYPADNFPTEEKVELGKLLFWDPILSGNKDVACVTCHHPDHGYAEQLDLSLGVGGEGLSENRRNGSLVKRNSISILNTAYNGITATGSTSPENAPMFWDNRTESLELQAIKPILSSEEMRGTNISEEEMVDVILSRLEEIPEYRNRFTQVFGENSITEENLGKAMAAFERTLVSNNSRFDQYANGDETALTSLEIRGMISFSEVGCDNCHNGPMFSDFELHVLTVNDNDKLVTPDNANGDFAFRTPTLRNIALTAPYMHNGTLSTLEDVLLFYEDVGDNSQNPNISDEQRDKKLLELNTADDKVSSIIAFLNSLTDENFDKEIPTEVPSKLKPGGNIK